MVDAVNVTINDYCLFSDCVGLVGWVMCDVLCVMVLVRGDPIDLLDFTASSAINQMNPMNTDRCRTNSLAV